MEEGLNPDSSPVVGTPRTRSRIRKRKGYKVQSSVASTRSAKVKRMTLGLKRSRCRFILSQLQRLGLRVVDLMNYIFDPRAKQGTYRWHDFLSIPGAGPQILDWWAASSAAEPQLTEWAVNYVAKKVQTEARKVTESRELQTLNKPINGELVLSLDLDQYFDRLESEWAPIFMKITGAFATSRHVAKHSESRREKTKLVRTHLIHTCLSLC